jgi:Flp pilus assembly pilin Flp
MPLISPENTPNTPHSRHYPKRKRLHPKRSRIGTEAIQQETRSGGKKRPEHHLERDKTMKILNIFKTFKNDESGAVTVDWVVLTAAIVGLGMVVMQTVGGGIEDLGDTVVADLQGRTSGYTSAPAAP